MPSTCTYTEQVFTGTKAHSLVWHGDELVDWVGGAVRYRPDGTILPRSVNYAHRFNMAVTEPQGEFTAIYTRVGTKGLLLRHGQIVRELNRSFYHAEAFEYPITLVRREGRVLLIHCPDQYNQLVVEDATTGERLAAGTAEAANFFHSRLTASPSGRYFLTAGWVWHPWSAVAVYDLDDALQHPEVLDTLDWCAPMSRNVGAAEEDSACWLSDDEILLSGGDEEDTGDPDITGLGENRLKPHGLAVFHIHARTIRSLCVPGETIGTMMPVGRTHVMTFYKHPRLIRLADGAVEFSLPHLASGSQTSSIIWSQEVPPLALDPARRRFALAQGGKVHVISIALP
jgi:hypothetical protein